jgi:hypothetical protein
MERNWREERRDREGEVPDRRALTKREATMAWAYWLCREM